MGSVVRATAVTQTIASNEGSGGEDENQRGEKFMRALLRGDHAALCHMLNLDPSLANTRERGYPCRRVLTIAAL